MNKLLTIALSVAMAITMAMRLMKRLYCSFIIILLYSHLFNRIKEFFLC